MPEARAVGPTTAQEMAFSCVSTPIPAQRERAVELVVKMGITVRIISRSSSSIMPTSAMRIFDVAIDAAHAVHGVVDAVAGDRLQHVHHFFAQREAGHEHGLEAHELGGDAGPENVRMQALELGHDHANVLRARRSFEAGELSMAWQSVSV